MAWLRAYQLSELQKFPIGMVLISCNLEEKGKGIKKSKNRAGIQMKERLHNWVNRLFFKEDKDQLKTKSNLGNYKTLNCHFQSLFLGKWNENSGRNECRPGASDQNNIDIIAEPNAKYHSRMKFQHLLP